MCGILGVVGNQVNSNWVANNIDSLIDRGPDNQTIKHVNGSCSLGATRLAMVDPLPRSNQPFTDGRYWLCFNGEVYNHKQLRASLISNHEFHTESDTEVLFSILKLKGLDGLRLVNGMYSFAFFDSKLSKLWLGRDELGKKPLYYCQLDKHIYFSSKRELLPDRVPNQKRDCLKDWYLLSYLNFGYILDPDTPSIHHKSVAAGEVVEVQVDNDGIHLKSKKIGKLDNIVVQRRNSSIRMHGGIRDKLTEAVVARITEHSTVGLSLSGGIDSSIISIILNDLGKSAKVYSAYWPDSDKARYNFDFHRAEKIADKHNHEFHPVSVVNSCEIPNQIEKFLNIMQEPNNNPTGLSMISIYEKMKENGVRLALTGDGGDEMFGGYSRYSAFLKYRRIRFLRPFLSILSNLGLLEKNYLSRGINIKSLNDWAYWHETFDTSQLQKDFDFSNGALDSYVFERKGKLSESLSPWAKDELKTLMYLDQKLWLSMESNRRLDRVSMAFSVEARSPFQDDVIREMFLDKEEGRLRRNLGKKELVNAFPELAKLGVLEEKMGFVSPMGHWLRQNQTDVISEIKSLSMRKEFARLSNLEVPTILISGNFAKIKQIWTLYILGKWFTRIDNRL
jgi:asparagine synthase (glutamine-hydrolysing)